MLCCWLGHTHGSFPAEQSMARAVIPVCMSPPPFFFHYLVYEAIGTVATPGLLCQPRVIVKMIVEKQMECRLAGETEVLGENLPQRGKISHDQTRV
jgi:hypothetical protein